MRQFATLLLLLILIGGCAPRATVLDGTSELSLGLSTQGVRSNLPAAEAKRFDKALLNIRATISASTGSDEERDAQYREILDGQSAAQVIAYSQSLQAESDSL